MRIGVVGAGPVGLVAAACFAEAGNHVTGMDIDAARVAALQRGAVPFFEPGLSDMVPRNLAQGRLRFTTDLADLAEHARVIFLCMGTPNDGSGRPDVRAFDQVATGLGPLLRDYTIVVTRSTVPVGTTERLRDLIRARTDCDFDVAANPEFLKEGNAVNDFMKPSRIILGVENARVADLLRELYAPFSRAERPVIVTNLRSAEMIKYVSNAFLATKISFINEMARLAERLEVDIETVRKGVGIDERIGFPFLFPGVGYGGSCLPKDVKALIRIAEDVGLNLSLQQAVDDINDTQCAYFVDKLRGHFGGALDGKTFAVWGISFKPRTDDLREAPSMTVLNALLDAGAHIAAHDPRALDNARRVFGNRLRYEDDPYAALRGADALIILTEWTEFRSPDFPLMRSLLRTPIIFDGRNLYAVTTMQRERFTYYSIGRPPVIPVATDAPAAATR